MGRSPHNDRRRRSRDRYRSRDRDRSKDRDRSRDRDDDRHRRSKRSRYDETHESRKRNKDETQNSIKRTDEVEKETKKKDDIASKTGGAYIPPAKLRMMRDNITDKSSVAYQRLAWEALKKSIHGLINKVNVSNIAIIVQELFKENIVRGRGLLCRSLLQAQAASPKFTHVYAALVAVVNSKFPQIGELLAKRCVIQFKRGYRRMDKTMCLSSSTFIAHLVNQQVLHEIIALELIMLLITNPTNDSVEVAISILRECGEKLTELSSKGMLSIFDQLREVLHGHHVDKRVEYMIEVMYQIRKDKFKDHPAIVPELDLIEEEDRFIHSISLDDNVSDPEDVLNVFKFDPNYEENEAKYQALCKEILGSDDESGDEADDESDSGDEDESADEGKDNVIHDETETNLVAFRRTVYLTINSSLDYEECAHKLLKMQMKPGQEIELCHMFLDCCAQQRTYEKFYGLLAQRFCVLNRVYIDCFKEIFVESYNTIHRLDTNRLRNVARFFGHLLYSDAIPWDVMSVIKLNEEDTTSSGRVFIKILFHELSEFMGMHKLRDRILDPSLEAAFAGLFPRDNPKNTRFAINFFTLIGLGCLTDELREFLKKSAPQMTQAKTPAVNYRSDSEKELDGDSSSSSESSSSSSSSSSSTTSSSSSS